MRPVIGDPDFAISWFFFLLIFFAIVEKLGSDFSYSIQDGMRIYRGLK